MYTPREKWVQDKQFPINEMQMVSMQNKNNSASFIMKEMQSEQNFSYQIGEEFNIHIKTSLSEVWGNE